MRALTLLSLMIPSIAFAGSGPWVVGPGRVSLWMGVESQRFTDIIGADGGFTGSGNKLGANFNSVRASIIGSVGLAKGMEAEFRLPYSYNVASRSDQGVCVDFPGGDACDTTQGIGPVVVRFKGLALDEVFGAPLSIALGVETRFGQFTANTRDRLTAIGEGTFDAGGFLILGRSGGLGQGYWSTYVETLVRYRVPIEPDYPAPDKTIAVPGWELEGSWELYFTPVQAVTFGPTFAYLWRPQGVDFEDMDPTSLERFSSLRLASTQVGGKVFLRGSDKLDFTLGGWTTLWAKNNPTDTWGVSLGIAIKDLGGARKE